MDEENQVVTPVEQTQAPEQPQYSDLELEALDMGWRPKTEWEGPEEDFIDAKNFVRNKSLFNKIDSLSKKVKDQDKALKLLKDHHSRVEEATRQQVIQELKKAKKTAYEEGDVDKAIEIDDEIAKQRSIELYERGQARQKQELHPDFVTWVEKNSWYAQDASLRSEADTLGLTYKQLHPEKDPDEVLDYVTRQVKKLYPEKFRNPNRSAPSMVEGTGAARPAKKQEDSFSMTEEEERVCKTFVRNGVMTRDEYVKELKKLKGV